MKEELDEAREEIQEENEITRLKEKKEEESIKEITGGKTLFKSKTNNSAWTNLDLSTSNNQISSSNKELKKTGKQTASVWSNLKISQSNKTIDDTKSTTQQKTSKNKTNNTFEAQNNNNSSKTRQRTKSRNTKNHQPLNDKALHNQGKPNTNINPDSNTKGNIPQKYKQDNTKYTPQNQKALSYKAKKQENKLISIHLDDDEIQEEPMLIKKQVSSAWDNFTKLQEDETTNNNIKSFHHSANANIKPATVPPPPPQLSKSKKFVHNQSHVIISQILKETSEEKSILC